MTRAARQKQIGQVGQPTDTFFFFYLSLAAGSGDKSRAATAAAEKGERPKKAAGTATPRRGNNSYDRLSEMGVYNK